MSDITFTGNKLLRSIANEFSNQFPYLWMRFYKQDGDATEWDVTHASIRAKKGAADLSTNGKMFVGTFEQRYLDAFGVKIEVMYTKTGRKYRSLDEDNKITLTDYNTKAKEKGATKAKEAHPDSFGL